MILAPQRCAERLILMAPAQAHPEAAQIMILSPLPGGGLAGLFSTHPPTEERIARLRGDGS